MTDETEAEVRNRLGRMLDRAERTARDAVVGGVLDLADRLDREIMQDLAEGEQACAEAGEHVPYMNEDGVLCSRCGLTLMRRPGTA